MSDENDESGVRFTRRGYLGAVGAAAAVAVGTAQAASAEEHGYGTSEYGAGPYGGQSEEIGDGDEGDDEDESEDEEHDEREAVPEIERLTGEDVSNPNNPHVDAELSWQASIDDSELYAALLTLSGPDGELKSWKYDLSGQTAEETETKRIPHGASGESTEYTVDLVVYSYFGETDEQTTTFESQ